MLQGEGHVAGPTLLFQQNWAPATQALVGLFVAAAAGMAFGRLRATMTQGKGKG